MAKFTYYALALAGTDFFLPEPSRGKDFAVTQPSAFAFPRLFKNENVAYLAKRVWERNNPGAELALRPLTLTGDNL